MCLTYSSSDRGPRARTSWPREEARIGRSEIIRYVGSRPGARHCTLMNKGTVAEYDREAWSSIRIRSKVGTSPHELELARPTSYRSGCWYPGLEAHSSVFIDKGRN